jgi:predicted AlkP superfamily phosphohydrolase/phosphomutase
MRTVAIGMDAADLPLVVEWVEGGELPTLQALRERGALARLRAEQPFSPESAWATMMTGCVPGKHGIYNWRQIVPGTHRLVRTPSRSFRQPFWTQLRSGPEPRRVLIVDVPYVSPAKDDGAVQVLGWGQRGAIRHESWPEDLLDRVQARHGRYPDGLDQDHHGRRRAGRRLFSELMRMTATRACLAIELMQEHDWDLAVIGFFETHHGGHAFHRYLDPLTFGHDVGRRWHSGALLDLYRAFDGALAKLLAAAGPDANAIVFSGFGMRPNTIGAEAVDQVMTGLGYQVPATPSAGARRTEWMRRAALNATPARVRRWVNRRLPAGTSERHLERLWTESIDWERTVAYSLSEPGHAFVQLAAPDAPNAAGLREEIAAEFRRLTEADTGQPAVEDVLDRHDVVSGPNASVLPDLAVLWSQDRNLERLRHPRLGVIKSDLGRSLVSEHTAQGFLIAAGPGIRPRDDALDGRWVDVAPTLLHLHGRPIPADVDGEPLDLLAESLGPPQRKEIDIADEDPWRGV